MTDRTSIPVEDLPAATVLFLVGPPTDAAAAGPVVGPPMAGFGPLAGPPTCARAAVPITASATANPNAASLMSIAPSLARGAELRSPGGCR